MKTALAIVLAAGEGTRMRSARPKVLHEVGNRALIGHVVDAAGRSGVSRLAVVVGPGMDAVAETARRYAEDVSAYTQTERLGTGHAVLSAREAITSDFDDVLVLLGDAPLVQPTTISAARDLLANGADLVVVGFRAEDPTGYGRLLTDGEQVTAIREDREANAVERRIDLCNSGIMAFSRHHMLDLVTAIDNKNTKGEFYLTDAIEIANRKGLSVRCVVAGEAEVMGINNRAQLAACEGIFQERRRGDMLEAGVSMIAPETVFFSADTEIAGDVTIEPNVVFGPEVRVEAGARICAFSHLEGAHVDEGARIGPYARLRPGAEIGAGARIGNFVEVKNASFGPGAKANHLAYVGDAGVGANANIGAGTITCNYDGFLKFRTEIGAGAFVGSNSSLVAPVTISDGAYVGSGSVVTKDVPADALAVGRGRQTIIKGWAAKFRAKKSEEKSKG